MQKSWLQRCFWLVAIWGASVATLALVGYAFRLLMTAAGFKS
jgi:Protein of unknown function (DUF2474).